ncbi:four-helix bundle copper-binding protein [Teichococcus oryzae]|uniref:Four-helix bundle copper-binding protein n=1 Tax=Teichococcus oryzae TaxID=1608942 RepID=A0A5B2TCB2_9PROT|nr:four-helix bundle copper-binding protein [Pseudoroseomonas oryzae]KAA2211714.1 four-helix bundle copper-binding protein [Pseudoroseomonas oryzae]
MHHLSEEMQACIEQCLKCYATCLSMASGHCLEAGGEHVEPKHFRLMLACAEMCRASAHLMLLGSPQHRQSCAACAEICRECAEDCERVGDMEACVAACRACAESCRAMAA